MSESKSKGRGPKRPSAPPDVMTIDDLTSYLQVSKSSLYKLAQCGKVPGQKVGKHWRFRRDTIDRWLDRQDQGRSSMGA